MNQSRRQQQSYRNEPNRDENRDTRNAQDYQTEFDYDRERETRHMRRDDQTNYRRPSDYYRASDYPESGYSYAGISETPHYQGSSEYREELDRRYPRQGRREIMSYGYEANRFAREDRESESDIEKFGERRGEEARGSYAGRGPRNYKRSDERINEEINEMLTRHSSIDADDITVEVKEGEVTLSGTVPERRMKHLAEDVAEGCFGVRDVTNNIRVKKAEESPRSSARSDRSRKSDQSSSSSH
ncbi:BON domain-containing protein [Bdellovibrio sp. HCB-110]|uniref:BON domain-containing protein n=1 Tax=Bdellovibrio sp. HCB-110 TaxID=3391182 RepID=UPI0039B589AC